MGSLRRLTITFGILAIRGGGSVVEGSVYIPTHKTRENLEVQGLIVWAAGWQDLLWLLFYVVLGDNFL